MLLKKSANYRRKKINLKTLKEYLNEQKIQQRMRSVLRSPSNRIGDRRYRS
jgi:hypothetical protein